MKAGLSQARGECPGDPGVMAGDRMTANGRLCLEH